MGSPLRPQKQVICKRPGGSAAIFRPSQITDLVPSGGPFRRHGGFAPEAVLPIGNKVGVWAALKSYGPI